MTGEHIPSHDTCANTLTVYRDTHTGTYSRQAHAHTRLHSKVGRNNPIAQSVFVMLWRGSALLPGSHTPLFQPLTHYLHATNILFLSLSISLFFSLSFFPHTHTFLLFPGLLLGQVSQEVQRTLGLWGGQLAVGAGVTDRAASTVGLHLLGRVLLRCLSLD